MGSESKPQVVHADSKNRMIMDGRFLEMEQKGEMMGMEYHSLFTIGFNNTDKKMVMTTITNMGTGILALSGQLNETTKEGALSGELTNPVTKKPIYIRQMISFPDTDTILIVNYDKQEDGDERKTMQYRFTRIKQHHNK